MMVRDEAVYLIRSRFANLLGQDERIIAEMKSAQNQLEANPNRPWFMQRTSSAEYEVTPDGYVIPPKDYLAEYDGDDTAAFWVKDGDRWYPLEKRQQTEFPYLAGPIGPPQYYAAVGEWFWYWPVPTVNMPMKLVYYGKEQSFDTNIENGWLKHAPNLIIGTGGMAICAFTSEMQTHLQYFVTLVRDARATLDAAMVYQREVNMMRRLELS